MKSLLIATLFTVALPALAADISIQHAWARPTAPGQPVSGAYFDITASSDAKLVKVDSPAASDVQVHEMKMDHGMMSMRPVDALPLPKGKTVSLKPGGYHVMLMDLKQPLKAGNKLPLTLTIESGGKTQQVKVEAEIHN